MSAAPPDRSRSGLAVVLVVGSALAVLAVSVGSQPIRAFDHFWHLRTGALIAETGEVPRTDPYTCSVPGARWVDMHWLYQLALHGLYAAGGHAAVVAAKTALSLVLVALVLAAGRGLRHPGLAALCVGLAVPAMAPRIIARPDLVSLALLAAVLALVLRDERAEDGGLYAVVPLQLLWANVHGLFALGLAVLAMALAAEWLRPRLPGGAAARPGRTRRLAVVLGLSALASLANPNGLDGALFPLRQLAMIGGTGARDLFGQVIAELRPTLDALPSLGAVPVASSLALAVLATAGVARARPPAWFDALLLLAFGWLGLAAARNVPLFALVAAIVALRRLGEALERGAPPRGRTAAVRTAGSIAAVAGLAAFAAATAWARFGPDGTPGPLAPLEVPERAVDWIAARRPPGPIRHRMADGGYLSWRLFPDYRILVDGRLEVYGAERFARLEGVGRSPVEAFEELDARHHFGTALVHYALEPDSTLLARLHRSSEWSLVFADDVAAVFVRGSEGRKHALGPEALGSLRPIPEHAPPREQAFRFSNRVRLLAATGHGDLARALVAEARSRGLHIATPAAP